MHKSRDGDDEGKNGNVSVNKFRPVSIILTSGHPLASRPYDISAKWAARRIVEKHKYKTLQGYSCVFKLNDFINKYTWLIEIQIDFSLE